MAKNSKTKSRAKASKPPEIPRPNQGRGKTIRIYAFIALFLLGIFSITALISYDKNQDIFFAESIFSDFVTKGNLNGTNACGTAGATFSMLSFNIFGIAAFLLPIFLFLFSYYMFRIPTKIALLWKLILCVFALCSGAVLLCTFPDGFYNFFSSDAVLDSSPRGPGGMLGGLLNSILSVPLGVAGTAIISLIVFCATVFALIVSSPLHTLRTLFAKLIASNKAKREAKQDDKLRSAKEIEGRRIEAIGILQSERNENSVYADPNAETADEVGTLLSNTNVEENAVTVDATALQDLDSPFQSNPEPDPEPETEPVSEPESNSTQSELEVNVAETIEKADTEDLDTLQGDYKFPPMDLLAEPSDAEQQGEDFQARGEEIVAVLKQFGYQTELSSVQVGPTITRYEVKPGPGVRVDRITKLQGDIAMGIRVQSARMLPVPEHGTIGIEVPNQKMQSVLIREILESKTWQDSKAKMAIPAILGKDITGKPVLLDIAKMPHGLIAGSSGSGKSVCLNGIITSILYNASPKDVRLVMVDPKVVELRVYNDAPHMLIPVITDMKRAPGALKWLTAEMEKRYLLLEKAGVRNIEGFNKKIAAIQNPDENPAEGIEDSSDSDSEENGNSDENTAMASDIGDTSNDTSAEEASDIDTSKIEVPRDEGVLDELATYQKLPYIVCIIDEYADIMAQNAAEVEGEVARLTAKARAAGIHLILATQRPDAKTVTGLIKSNLGTRIALRVTSGTNSQIILDEVGAETLIGKGDMLILEPGFPILKRAQGVWVSEEEIEHIVDYLAKNNGKPKYSEDVTAAIDKIVAEAEEDKDDDTASAEGDDDETLRRKSFELFIRNPKYVSISFLQRKLRIGYGKAARIVDELADRGYIGESLGPNKPREILKSAWED